MAESKTIDSKATYYDLYTGGKVKKPNMEKYYSASAHNKLLKLEEKRRKRKVK